MSNWSSDKYSLLIAQNSLLPASTIYQMVQKRTGGKVVNQALRGLGSRPSPLFVAMALNRIGFPHVYGVEPGGEHEDFSFERRNDGQSVRDGHPLRCLFVASHQPLSSARLVPLVD